MADQMLTGSRPIFLVHKSQQHADRLPELVRYLDRTIGSQLELGIVVNLSRQQANATRRFLDRFDFVPLRIADPELHSHPSQRGTAQGRQLKHDYLRDPIPNRPTSSWIRAYFDQQRQSGATALLSPTGWVADTDGERELTKAMKWVRAARAEGPIEPLAVSLTLSRSWLIDPVLRAALLNELVDSSERLWYIRVLWNVLQPRYGQLRDEGLLLGYRELASVASVEDKLLILPNTGLTGWLAVAWGAAGLSTGTGLPEQAFAQVQEIRIKSKDRPAPRPRYFERGLLHTVDLTTHQAMLQEANYPKCDCPYCLALRATDPVPDLARWSRETWALHGVVQVGRHLSRLVGRNPRATAHREVQAARQYLSTLGLATPQGENMPQHLPIWDRLLA